MITRVDVESMRDQVTHDIDIGLPRGVVQSSLTVCIPSHDELSSVVQDRQANEITLARKEMTRRRALSGDRNAGG